MADRSINEVIATGGCYVNYDPLDMLKELSACISYRGGVGYCIELSDAMQDRLRNVIAFNTGGDSLPPAPKSGDKSHE